MESLCAEIITLKFPGNFLPCVGLQNLMGTFQKWWISKKKSTKRWAFCRLKHTCSLFSELSLSELEAIQTDILRTQRGDTKLGFWVFPLKSLFSSADFLQVYFLCHQIIFLLFSFFFPRDSIPFPSKDLIS